MIIFSKHSIYVPKSILSEKLYMKTIDSKSNPLPKLLKKKKKSQQITLSS